MWTQTQCCKGTALYIYSKTCLKQPLKKKDQKLVFKTKYRLMQVKSIAECSREHSAILTTCIKLTSVFYTFVLSNFERLLKTGFTVFEILTPKDRLHAVCHDCLLFDGTMILYGQGDWIAE